MARQGFGYLITDALGVGYLLALVRSDRRALHDLVFGSQVVVSTRVAMSTGAVPVTRRERLNVWSEGYEESRDKLQERWRWAFVMWKPLLAIVGAIAAILTILAKRADATLLPAADAAAVASKPAAKALSLPKALALTAVQAGTAVVLLLNVRPLPQDASPSPPRPPGLSEAIQVSLRNLERYWQVTYPEVYGSPFQALRGGYRAYMAGEVAPPCARPPDTRVGGGSGVFIDPSDSALYCPDEDLIAWDEATVLSELADEFGLFTVGIVLASEFGLAVQARADVRLPSPLRELQVVCFTGSWSRWIAEGRRDDLVVDEGTLDSVLSFLAGYEGPQRGGPPGQVVTFGPTDAFQDGWTNSASRCAGYTDNPPVGEAIPPRVTGRSLMAEVDRS